MDDQDKRIKFKSEKLAKLFADENDRLILVGGAITTPGRYSRFDESLCHLCDDGHIRRYGREIGTVDDIEILGDYDDTEIWERMISNAQ